MKSIHFPPDTPAPLPHGWYAKGRDGWWVHVGKMPSGELELLLDALAALRPVAQMMQNSHET